MEVMLTAKQIQENYWRQMQSLYWNQVETCEADEKRGLWTC